MKTILVSFFILWIAGCLFADNNDNIEKIKQKIDLFRQRYFLILNSDKDGMKLLDEIADLVNQLSRNSNVVFITNNSVFTNPVVIVMPQSQSTQAQAAPEKTPMTDAEFNKILSEYNDAAFDNDKYQVIETAAGSAKSYFKIDQIATLMKLYTFDDDRLKILKLTYPKSVGRENAYSLYNYFNFPDSKKKVKDIIERYKD